MKYHADLPKLPLSDIVNQEWFLIKSNSEKLEFLDFYTKNRTEIMELEDRLLLNKHTTEIASYFLIVNWREQFYKRISEIEDLNDKKSEVRKELANLKLKRDTKDLQPKDQKKKIDDLESKDLILVVESYLDILNTYPDEVIKETIEPPDTITSMLLLYMELGIFELLKNRVKENGKNGNLEKLVAHLIKADNADSVGKYFPGMEPGSEARNHPYTVPAIKKMEDVLRKCNIKLKNTYIPRIKKKD